MMLQRRDFLVATGALLANPHRGDAEPSTARSARAVARAIRSEYLHVWHAYRRIAWGRDEFMPLAARGSDFFIPGHSVGLSIVEALDTLYLMELDTEVAAAVAWLRANLSFDIDGDMQMFEAVIRMVGGLIAGFHATQEQFLVAAARDLADRLLPCFAKSPSGVPYRYVNLRTGAVRENVTNLAEAGTNILEFGELSRLTGDPKYYEAAKRSYRTILAKRSALDLLASSFDVEKGDFVAAADVAPDPPSDSFYEYLWGAWVLFGDVEARDWYDVLTKAILQRKLVRNRQRTWFAHVSPLTGAATMQQSQSELAAFYAGLLAKGGDLKDGEAYYDSWTAVAERYRLIPEEIDYATLAVIDPRYLLRPEYANSAFDLWFLTYREKYRSTALRHFENVRSLCRVKNGYTILKDVTSVPVTRGDLFPAYAFAENFKYLYLTFADAPRFDAARHYLSTEGKVLRGLVPRGARRT